MNLLYFLFLFPLLVHSAGWLEEKEGQRILHLRGTAYERGFDHGRLLKEDIQANIATFITSKKLDGSQLVDVLPYISPELCEELEGIADGADVPLADIRLLNLFPELFHCTGVTASHGATRDGSVYHARVLDYGVGAGLQKTAVLMAVEPTDGGHRYINVAYAGFVGSVTGMNEAKVAVGEIGGKGYGNWKGVPMAFLIRMILQHCSSLEEAKELLSISPRTCEYFYVLSDGKTNRALGVYALPESIEFIEPENHCLQMVGKVNLQRLPPLRERMAAAHGSIDERTLMEAVRKPVTSHTNLHNAIFHPSTLRFWVSHAGSDGTAASEQPYVAYSFRSLF